MNFSFILVMIDIEDLNFEGFVVVPPFDKLTERIFYTYFNHIKEFDVVVIRNQYDK